MNGQMDGGMRNIITSIKESIGQSIYSLASQSINQSTNPWASQLEKQSVILIDWLTDWLTNRLFCLLISWSTEINCSVSSKSSKSSWLLSSKNSVRQLRWGDKIISHGIFPGENHITTSVYINFASASLLCITSSSQSKVTVRSY